MAGRTEPAPAAPEEAGRIEALARDATPDSAPEPGFDRIARLAAQGLGAPIAMLALVAGGHVRLKASLGLANAGVASSGLASEGWLRQGSLAEAVMGEAGVTVVPDARSDPRFAADPLVQGPPHARFCAGIPLVTAEGQPIGALCVLDPEPRAGLDPAEARALEDLAALAMERLAPRTAHEQPPPLRESLLASNADAPTLEVAIDAATNVLREAAGGMLCLLFRTAPGGRKLQLLGGTTDQPAENRSYLDTLRRIEFTLENSLAGQVIQGETQSFFHSFTPELLERYPGLKLSAEQGARAQLITPLRLGEGRYCIVLSFREAPPDLEPVKALMREGARNLRPLLRRLHVTETAQLFQRAVDASGDAVMICDAEAMPGAGPRIRHVNPAFTAQTGYSAAEAIGQSLHLLEGPDSPAAARQAIRAALALRQPVRQELLVHRRDGTSFWADLQVAPVTDSTGWLTHWVAVQRDVTAQKLEALALAEREAYFRYFFEQHPAPMWVYDRETLRFLEVNEAAIRAYGMSREEFRQRTILDIRPPEDREAALEMVGKLSPAFMDSGPWRHIRANGVLRLVQTRGQVIRLRGREAHLVVIWDVTERIKAEQSAHELAAELNSTLESISDGFFTLDAEWRFRYANARAEEMLDQPTGSLLGRAIDQALPGARHAPLVNRLRELRGEGASGRLLHRDMTSGRWLDITGYPAPTGGLTVYLRDVTAQRGREERLRLLETVVEQLNDVILITEAEPIDLPGPRIVYANSAFERLTGYTVPEVLGRTPRLLQGPGTDRAELRRIRKALATWRPVRAELQNYTKAGQAFWIELDIAPVADEEGIFTHWVAVERDVTERKRAQIKLEEQAALLDQSRDAIMVRDMQDRITYWNRSAERLYGWTAQEVQGRSAVELLYPEPGVFEEARAALLRDGHWSGMMRQRRKDGETMILEAHKTLLRNADGSPRAILAVDSDVTKRVALEEQLRQAQRMEAVGQLTGGIAHDFNNLLTVVLGNAEILVERLAEEPALQPIAAVTLAAAERGAALTGRLLAFSRQQRLNPRVIDAHELLQGLRELIRRAVQERVEIALETTPGLWPALIDPPQLETAILNLCVNARDAMPHGGRVTITTSNVTAAEAKALGQAEMAEGDHVLISVRDNGTGMPPEVAARAFEPFFTTKEVGKGSGLGLSMVYGFVKQSGGHVSIETQPGQGTTIRIYIPRAHAAAEPLAERRGVAVPEGGSERVLLVEDDPLVRDHSARQLRRLGYAVEVAENGAEGLRRLEGPEHFDLLFTDIVMPGGISGDELASAALRLRPGIGILLSSGYSEQSGTPEGWLKPGMQLLPKPYRLRELAEKLREALAGAG